MNDFPRLIREIEDEGRTLRICIDRDDAGKLFVSIIAWVDGKPTDEQVMISESMLRDCVEKLGLMAKFFGGKP